MRGLGAFLAMSALWMAGLGAGVALLRALGGVWAPLGHLHREPWTSQARSVVLGALCMGALAVVPTDAASGWMLAAAFLALFAFSFWTRR
jgi:hypothetical protein